MGKASLQLGLHNILAHHCYLFTFQMSKTTLPGAEASLKHKTVELETSTNRKITKSTSLSTSIPLCLSVLSRPFL